MPIQIPGISPLSPMVGSPRMGSPSKDMSFAGGQPRTVKLGAGGGNNWFALLAPLIASGLGALIGGKAGAAVGFSGGAQGASNYFETIKADDERRRKAKLETEESTRQEDQIGLQRKTVELAEAEQANKTLGQYRQDTQRTGTANLAGVELGYTPEMIEADKEVFRKGEETRTLSIAAQKQTMAEAKMRQALDVLDAPMYEEALIDQGTVPEVAKQRSVAIIGAERQKRNQAEADTAHKKAVTNQLIESMDSTKIEDENADPEERAAIYRKRYPSAAQKTTPEIMQGLQKQRARSVALGLIPTLIGKGLYTSMDKAAADANAIASVILGIEPDTTKTLPPFRILAENMGKADGPRGALEKMVDTLPEEQQTELLKIFDKARAGKSSYLGPSLPSVMGAGIRKAYDPFYRNLELPIDQFILDKARGFWYPFAPTKADSTFKKNLEDIK